MSAMRTGKRASQFAELLKVEARLALREPYGVLGGIGLPVVLLTVFGLISRAVTGNVGGTGLSVIALWIPTILVIAFITIAISLPNTLVRDREIGWPRRVSTTPIHPAELLAAQLVIDLVLAGVAMLVILFGGALVFGAPLKVSIPTFVFATVLSVAEIFALGLVVVALAPSQAFASAAAGVLFFALMFLSGLWVQAVQLSGPIQTIMYYSPSGAAVRALLSAAFSAAPPYAAWATMAAYAVIFGFVAIRYFRWE
jgi:ABC-2 type transport system permease protein